MLKQPTLTQLELHCSWKTLHKHPCLFLDTVTNKARANRANSNADKADAINEADANKPTAHAARQ